MAQILVQVSEQMLSALEKVAPGKSRLRSRFIRLAIERALMEVRDIRTREAYARAPDEDVDWFDPRVWGEWNPRASSRKKRTRKHGRKKKP
jgi:hypothetical protein